MFFFRFDILATAIRGLSRFRGFGLPSWATDAKDGKNMDQAEALAYVTNRSSQLKKNVIEGGGNVIYTKMSHTGLVPSYSHQK